MMQSRCMMKLSFALLIIVAAGAAQAQLYRWIDEKGRVNITDTPPPPTAKDVQTKNPAAAGAAEPAQTPFELAQAIRDFPVVLYTAPDCKQPCTRARDALNRRAVPFQEIQVWEERMIEEVKRLSGNNQVPVLVVGRSVQSGFEQGAYDALLDAARYPKAGLLPPRAQAAPPPPEGYSSAEDREAPRAEPVKPAEEETKPTGPYAPGAPPQQRPRKK